MLMWQWFKSFGNIFLVLLVESILFPPIFFSKLLKSLLGVYFLGSVRDKLDRPLQKPEIGQAQRRRNQNSRDEGGALLDQRTCAVLGWHCLTRPLQTSKSSNEPATLLLRWTFPTFNYRSRTPALITDQACNFT